MPSEYRPRLNVDVTEQQAELLNKYLDYGMRKQVFGVILDDMFALFDVYGPSKVIGALIEKAISLKDVCKLDLED